MTDQEKMSQWFKHDGNGCPVLALKAWERKGYCLVETRHSKPGATRTSKQIATDVVDPDHPGWTWRRSGPFGLWGDWQASDPKYGRILRYRFVRPPQAKASKSVQMLRDIAAGKKEPAEA